MARTDWTTKDTVRPADMNQIGQEINDLGSSVTVWLGVTEGTDTEYTVTSSKVSSLFEGLRVSFRAHVASGANPTLQIDSLGVVPLKKPNGRAAKLDADGVYTAVYSAGSFILQGEGGEYGTATAEDVLAPKTIGTDNGIVTGTMPDRRNSNWATFSEQVKSIGIYPEDDSQGQIIFNGTPKGFVDNTTEHVAIIGGLIPSQVAAGHRVGNVYDPNPAPGSVMTGTYTNDATATEGDILSGKTGYVQGKKITGNIPILTGIRTATGTAKWGDGALAVYPERGYQKGGAGDGEIKVPPALLQQAEPNLQSVNIPIGKSMFGIGGTFGTIKRTVSGSTTIPKGGNRPPNIDISGYNLIRGNTILYFTVRTKNNTPCSYRVQGVAQASDPFPYSPLVRLEFYLDAIADKDVIVINYQLIEYNGVRQRIDGYVTRDTGTNPLVVDLPNAVANTDKCIIVGSYSTTETVLGNFDPALWFASVSRINLIGSVNPGFYERWYYQILEFN